MNILIVGGGFAGVKTALELNHKSKHSITLISDKDHLLYFPALYATATGKSKLQSIIPLSTIFEDTRVKIVEDKITGYDPTRKIVKGTKEYSYDRVVFALGVVTSYFGIKGLDKFSYGIKSATELDRFRKHLHDELSHDHHKDMSYVIVGAGPTGVELSAALASYLRFISKRHNVKKSKISIKLVEAAPRVLPRMDEATSRAVTKHLRSLGVSVMTNKKVEAQDDDSIIISGKEIPSHTVVWTSGVTNNPFFQKHSSHFNFAPNSKVTVDEYMMSDENTYVIGDNAATQYSGLALTAVRDARFVADDIIRSAKRLPRKKYKAQVPATVVPAGNKWAAFEWRDMRIAGFIGYLLRRAADMVAYRDILPMKAAVRAWRSEDWLNEDCTKCM